MPIAAGYYRGSMEEYKLLEATQNDIQNWIHYVKLSIVLKFKNNVTFHTRLSHLFITGWRCVF
jgi:hypothetical protein